MAPPLRDADLDHLQPVGKSWPTCDGEGTEEGTAGPEVKNASSGFFLSMVIFGDSLLFQQQNKYLRRSSECTCDRGNQSIAAVNTSSWLPATPSPSFLTRYLTALQHNLGRDFMTRNINFYGSANPLANFIP